MKQLVKPEVTIIYEEDELRRVYQNPVPQTRSILKLIRWITDEFSCYENVIFMIADTIYDVRTGFTSKILKAGGRIDAGIPSYTEDFKTYYNSLTELIEGGKNNER